MLEIKLTNPYAHFPLIRQTPHSLGLWGDCRFHVNEDVERCDYWIIYDGLAAPEQTRCDRKNVILVAVEFPAIKPRYDQAFLDQFGTMITFSRSHDRPRVIDTIVLAPWFAGIQNPGTDSAMLGFWDYDRFLALKSPPKTKLLSVVSSNKDFTQGHRERIAFVDMLQNHFGNKIDAFGRGRRDLPDKLGVLLDYKYHIALENSVCRNGISEKLLDAFLGWTYPIYFGAPNVFDYFPERSLSVIDIKYPEKAINKIEKLINEDAYAASIDSIETARNLTLDKYNLFAVLADYCSNDSANSLRAGKEEVVRIEPERPPVESFIDRLAIKFHKAKSWIVS